MTELITKLQKYDSPLWGHHFPIPEEIAGKYIEGNNRRIICYINNQHKMQCAIMPSKEGFFILINKHLVNKLQLGIGEDVRLSIEKDHSEFGHEVPESFQVLLAQDEEGRGFFEQLTPGKQRSLIYIVGKVKNIDSQLNKGMAILDHLKLVNGELDFKKLNAMIKEYNQRSKLK
jgi:hypothetical protein